MMKDQQQIPKTSRCIRFGNIEFLELPIVIGDNPSAIGVPIGVDWWRDNEECDGPELDPRADKIDTIIASPLKRRRQQLGLQPVPHDRRWTVSLDDYENDRPLRRKRCQLHISRRDREKMLLRNGFSEQQIRLAEFEALIIRRSRRESQYDPEDCDLEDDDCSCSCDSVTELNDMKIFESNEEPNTNIKEETSPVKLVRGKVCFDSMAKLSPPLTQGQQPSIWGTGGSPDQPLQGMARRLSINSMTFYDFVEDGKEEQDTHDESSLADDADDFAASREGLDMQPPLTYSSSSFDRMYESLPPMQPLSIPARTA